MNEQERDMSEMYAGDNRFVATNQALDILVFCGALLILGSCGTSPQNAKKSEVSDIKPCPTPTTIKPIRRADDDRSPPVTKRMVWWYQAHALFVAPTDDRDSKSEVWLNGTGINGPNSLLALDVPFTGQPQTLVDYSMTALNRNCVVLLHKWDLVSACTNGNVARTVVDFSQNAVVGVFEGVIVILDPDSDKYFTWDGVAKSELQSINPAMLGLSDASFVRRISIETDLQ